jgi:hypothetical protein
MTGVLLDFPKSAIIRDTTAQTNERIAAAKEAGVKNFADAVANDIGEDIALNLSSCGIDIETEQFQKDFTLLYAIMAGMIYRAVDLTHPIHPYMDDSVKAVSLQDENQSELPL